MWAEGYAGYVIAAFSLDELQSSGTELSQVGEGFIDYVGTTSVTVNVDVFAQRKARMEIVKVTDANLTYVHIDKNGKPKPITK